MVELELCFRKLGFVFFFFYFLFFEIFDQNRIKLIFFFFYLSKITMDFQWTRNLTRVFLILFGYWSAWFWFDHFFFVGFFFMKRLVFTTHLICWVDFAFESVWSVCIFMFYLCVCMYLSFTEINAMCFILFCRFCILWLGFCVCVVGFNVLLNEMIWDMIFSELCF